MIKKQAYLFSVFVQISSRSRYSRISSGTVQTSCSNRNFFPNPRPKAVTCKCVLGKQKIRESNGESSVRSELTVYTFILKIYSSIR